MKIRQLEKEMKREQEELIEMKKEEEEYQQMKLHKINFARLLVIRFS